MAIAAQNITPCLWFDTEAEEAAKFYISVFQNSRITDISRYGNEGQDIHGKAGHASWSSTSSSTASRSSR